MERVSGRAVESRNELGAVLEVMKNEGPCEKVTLKDVLKALRFMKNGKAAGPSGVTLDFLKVSGIESAKRLANVTNDMLQGNSMPESWRRSDLITF